MYVIYMAGLVDNFPLPHSALSANYCSSFLTFCHRLRFDFHTIFSVFSVSLCVYNYYSVFLECKRSKTV